MTAAELIAELQKYPPGVIVKVSSPFVDGDLMEVERTEHQEAVPAYGIEEYVSIHA